MGYIDSFPPPAAGLSGEDYYRTVAFTDDLEWEMDSYLFALARHINDKENWHTYLPRYVVNQANDIPYHGETLFDDCRVMATPHAAAIIQALHGQYVAGLETQLRQLNPSHIDITNNAQTTLSEEICTHAALVDETHNIFIPALASDNPQLIDSSTLVNGVEVVECPRLYHPILVSFYLAGLRSHGLNTAGTRLAEFKNYYNVLEYYMASDGLAELQRVIEKKVGKGNLGKMIKRIRQSFNPQTYVAMPTLKDEDFFGTTLPKLVPSRRSFSADVAHRIYTKRNAVMHSKKIRNGSPSISINPSRKEAVLEFEVVLLRAMAEHIIAKAKNND
ncbi:MAG TPA: hypothetical protein VF733_03835 [Candidatus Saccharimonadales bacterium]